MTLTDDIAAAEARAREAVWNAAMAHRANWVPDEGEIDKTRGAWEAAADCYAAVCRLAGKWDAGCVGELAIRAELARLMEGA